jgi:hypothetical protein
MTYLKQAIEINERDKNPQASTAKLEALLSLELDDKVTLTPDQEQEYLDLL